MPKKKPVGNVLFLRGVGDLAPTINKIAEDHGISPQELGRGLLKAACAFYDEHGFFKLPVLIIPQLAAEVRFVAERQAGYPPSPPASRSPPLVALRAAASHLEKDRPAPAQEPRGLPRLPHAEGGKHGKK